MIQRTAARPQRGRAAAACAGVALLAATLAGCSEDSRPAPTSTATATPSFTSTAVFTPTATRTSTPTPPGTATPTATASRSATSTPTASLTSTPTASLTATPSPSATIARTPLSCAGLAGLALDGVLVRSAAVVAAAGDKPEHCRLSGRVEPALNFELRMPVEWNGKIVFFGGGGYDGSIPDGSGVSPGVLRGGYTTLGTDSGHRGSPFDGSWALDDMEAVDNFADLGRHRVLVVAREIVLAHYAAPIRRTYFEGGSNGGREALIEAQRWAADYDGVIAREPVLSFTALMLAANRNAKRLFATPAGGLSNAAIHTLTRAVLAACDRLDGLEDDLVGDVASCHLDTAALRCTDGASTDCLTQDEIDTIATLHADFPLGFALAHGVDRHPGYALSGAEDSPTGWPLWLMGLSSSSASSLMFALQDPFIKYFVTRDPQFDSLGFSPADAVEALTGLSQRLDATDPDLSAFTSHGGKVILWHGWADAAISPYGTVEYYRRIVAAAGGQERADEFARLYLSPGIDHNGNGKGAPIFDLIAALDAWVESGTGPGDLVAYKVDNGATIPFRPLCRYPTYPRYRGSGDVKSADSFECAGSESRGDLPPTASARIAPLRR